MLNFSYSELRRLAFKHTRSLVSSVYDAWFRQIAFQFYMVILSTRPYLISLCLARCPAQLRLLDRSNMACTSFRVSSTPPPLFEMVHED